MRWDKQVADSVVEVGWAVPANSSVQQLNVTVGSIYILSVILVK